MSDTYYQVMWIALLVLSLVAPAVLAARKGYDWYCWVLGGSILGLLVLATLPYANAPETSPEQQAAARLRGNRYGIGLTVLSVFVGFALFVAMLPGEPARRPPLRG